MPKKGWKHFAIRDSTKKLFDKLKGKLTADEFLVKLIRDWERFKEKVAILETKHIELTGKTPCFSRYEDEGLYWCVTKKAHAVKLSTLKICRACPSRLTPERVKAEGIALRTSYYWTCGATERYDEKAGLMLFCKNPMCPVHIRGRWHSTQACVEASCPHMKRVKTK